MSGKCTGKSAPLEYSDLLVLVDQLRQTNHELRRLTSKQRQQIADLSEQSILLTHRAKYDELTGLYRRGEFELQARKLLEDNHIIRRGNNIEGKEIHLVLLDIRGFKKVNDDGGQKKGDIVLRNAAEAIQGRMRKIDLYCRFGGDEFGALLIGVTLEQITQIVDEINENLIEIDDRISFRFGHAQFIPGETYDELCQRADDELYETKRIESKCNK